MATYLLEMSRPGHPSDDRPRCDRHSRFDAEGFPLDGRSWAPVYGAPCEECGEPC